MTLLDLAIGVLWVMPGILAITSIGIVFVILYWLVTDYRKTFADLFDESEAVFQNLLRRGEDGAFIQFKHRRSGKSVRFNKYLRLAGTGIAFELPDDWPHDDMEKLRRWCDANGLTIGNRGTEDTPDTPPLTVDCGRDIDCARALARAVWLDIFGLTPQSRCKYTNRNIWACDGMVDSPGYAGLTDKEKSETRVKRYLEQDRRRRLRYGEWPSFGLGSIFSAIVATGLVVSLFGLPIATLLSIGEPADWILATGATTISGSTASLIFFAVFLSASLLLSLENTGWTIREAETETTKHQIAQCAYWLFMDSLLIAVVAVWIGG